MLAPSAGQIVCPFTTTLPAGEVAATVTGRIEQQLLRYDRQNRPTAAGTHVLQETQPVGDVSGGETTDACVRLSDFHLGTVHDLGEFCAGADAYTVTRPFIGRVTVAEDASCEFSVPNTARLVANNTGATAEATISVSV